MPMQEFNSALCDEDSLTAHVAYCRIGKQNDSNSCNCISSSSECELPSTLFDAIKNSV